METKGDEMQRKAELCDKATCNAKAKKLSPIFIRGSGARE